MNTYKKGFVAKASTALVALALMTGCGAGAAAPQGTTPPSPAVPSSTTTATLEGFASAGPSLRASMQGLDTA